MIIVTPAVVVSMFSRRPQCGAVCPSGPYVGVNCTKEPHGAEVEHEATAERRPGAVDVLEVWK